MVSRSAFDVAVIGGGVAGIAAAVALAQSGKRVALIERRPTLGGRVHSHSDARTGDVVDNGPHLFMGCYHHARRLLRALGTEHLIRYQPRLELRMSDDDGDIVLRAAPLPGDLSFAVGLARMRGVSLRDVWHARHLLGAARGAVPELDEITCTQWFEDLGIPSSIRRLVLNPICLAALNDVPERSSAALLARVLRQAFSGKRGHDGLGFIVGPHTGLFATVGDHLKSRGSELITGTRVERIAIDNGAASAAELAGGGVIEAREFVVAVPHRHVASLFPGASHPDFETLAQLGACPIVNIHLWLDRPVMEHPLVGLVDRATQWVFSLDHLWPRRSRLSRVVGVISGNVGAAEWSNAELVDQMMEDLRARFSAARQATVERSIVIKERESTFAPRSGLLTRRPGPRSPWPNVWWAGDWTNTGLPSTIEGAAQSGHEVAEALIHRR